MKKSSDAPTAAEEELRQAELLLRAVLETAPGLIYAKDRAGRMLIANPPTLDLISKPWALVKGRTDAELLDDRAQGEAIMANDRRVMDAGVAEVLEEVVGTEDGLTRIWLSTKAPLRDEAGAVIGLVGISQNITDRKQAERRLVELNETLEERVAERTAERDRGLEELTGSAGGARCRRQPEGGQFRMDPDPRLDAGGTDRSQLPRVHPPGLSRLNARRAGRRQRRSLDVPLRESLPAQGWNLQVDQLGRRAGR